MTVKSLSAMDRADRPLVQKVRPRDLLLVNDLSAVLLLVWYLVPAFKIEARSIFFAVALGLWLVTSFCIQRDWLSIRRSHVLALAAWYTIYVLNFLLGRSSMFWEYLYIMTVFFTPVLLFHFYERTGQTHKLAGFARLILILLAATAITTLIGQYMYPIPSRILSMGIESYTLLYSRANIGGFGFTYGLMLFAIAYAAYVRKLKRSPEQLAQFVLLLFFLFVILKTEFTIAVGLAVLGVALAFQLRQRKVKATFLFVISAALAVVLIFDMILPYADAIARGISSDTIRARVLDVIHFLSSGDLTGDFALRADKYKISVDTALQNPILGAGAWYGYDSEVKGIGGHVEIFDLLARYGLVGTLPLLWFFVRNFRHTWELYQDTGMREGIIAFFVLFALYACTNTFLTSSEIGLVVFFAVPAMAFRMNPHPLAPSPRALGEGE